MDNTNLRAIRCCLVHRIKHKKTNFFLANLIGFVTIYMTLTAVFDRNFFHPFRLDNINSSQTSENFVANISYDVMFPEHNKINKNKSAVENVFPVNSKGVSWLDTDSSDSLKCLVQTIFSLFVLWCCSLTFGYITSLFYLPNMLGMIVVGVVFANASIFNGILSIHRTWGDVIRQLSFIMCLIRCGIGINMQELKQSWFICAKLGIVSATFEILTVVLFVCFFFSVPVEVAFLFSCVLASNSPAVTVPVMLELAADNRGADKNILTAMLASVGIDNIFCVSCYTIINALIFKRSYDDIMYIVTIVIVELSFGALFGTLIGLLLGMVPRPDSNMLHVVRTFLMFTTSCGFLIGSVATKCETAGPILVLVMCLVASDKWKSDNPLKSQREEQAFKVMWDYFFLPLLFALVGVIFDFSVLSWNLFLQAMATLIVGICARLVSAFVISLCTNLNFKEKLFLAFCFVPKATVQAVLVPFMIQHQAVESNALFIALTCVLGIVITAPIGQFLMHILGVVCLKQCNNDNEYKSSNMKLTMVSSISSETQNELTVDCVVYEKSKQSLKAEFHSTKTSLNLPLNCALLRNCRSAESGLNLDSNNKNNFSLFNLMPQNC